MAGYKYVDTSPRFLPVDLARQLLPDTFEHAVNHVLDHAVDLSAFDARLRNDETGPHRRCCSRWCCAPTHMAS